MEDNEDAALDEEDYPEGVFIGILPESVLDELAEAEFDAMMEETNG